MAKRSTKPQRDWTLTAERIGVGLDRTWIRHIKECANVDTIEAEKIFNGAVSSRVLRCDTDACQLFLQRHGMSIYYYHKPLTDANDAK